MQIMPKTADFIAKNLVNVESYDIFDGDTNLLFGIVYLRYLLDKFNVEDYAILAYNAGEGNVSSWIDGDLEIPYLETKNYLKRIKRRKSVYKVLTGWIMEEQIKNQSELDLETNSKYIEYVTQKKLDEDRKVSLILAVWGVLLGVVYGLGIVLSVLSLIFLKVKMVKFGTTYKWTISLAVIGLLLSLIFIVFETLLLISILQGL